MPHTCFSTLLSKSACAHWLTWLLISGNMELLKNGFTSRWYGHDQWFLIDLTFFDFEAWPASYISLKSPQNVAHNATGKLALGNAPSLQLAIRSINQQTIGFATSSVQLCHVSGLMFKRLGESRVQLQRWRKFSQNSLQWSNARLWSGGHWARPRTRACRASLWQTLPGNFPRIHSCDHRIPSKTVLVAHTWFEWCTP